MSKLPEHLASIFNDPERLREEYAACPGGITELHRKYGVNKATIRNKLAKAGVELPKYKSQSARKRIESNPKSTVLDDKESLEKALGECNGSFAELAARLGVHRGTVSQKAALLGVSSHWKPDSPSKQRVLDLLVTSKPHEVADSLGVSASYVTHIVKQSGLDFTKHTVLTKDKLQSLVDAGMYLQDMEKELSFDSRYIVKMLQKYGIEYQLKPYTRIISKEDLIRLHHDEGLTFKHIAQIYGVSDVRIGQLADEYGIEVKMAVYSMGEKAVGDFVEQYYPVIRRDRNLIGFELDVVVPHKKLTIEYNGLYWHSFNQTESTGQRIYHYLKFKKCLEKDHQLLTIWESEWNDPIQQEIWKSTIRAKLGASQTRLFARKCRFDAVDPGVAMEFCRINHIQGAPAYATYSYGLFYEDELVAVIVYHNHKDGYLLNRLCFKLNTSIVGGSTKLFRHSVDVLKADHIITYSDNRYSLGGIYETMGFQRDRKIQCSYGYCKSGVMYSKRRFRLDKQRRMFANFDPTLSEAENMFNNGYRRIWDAGYVAWIWKRG